MTVSCAVNGWCIGMRYFGYLGMAAIALNLAMVGFFKQIIIDVKNPFFLPGLFTFRFLNPPQSRVFMAHGTVAFHFGQTNGGCKQQ